MLVSCLKEILISCLKGLRSQCIASGISPSASVKTCQTPPLKYCGSSVRTTVCIPSAGRNKLPDSQFLPQFSDQNQSGTEKVNHFKDACPWDEAAWVTRSWEIQFTARFCNRFPWWLWKGLASDRKHTFKNAIEVILLSYFLVLWH